MTDKSNPVHTLRDLDTLAQVVPGADPTATDDVRILRVPGGWIYTILTPHNVPDPAGQPGTFTVGTSPTSVFVPYSKEFITQT